MAQGVDDYNVMYTDHCSTYSQSTQKQQNSDTLYFESQTSMQSQNGKTSPFLMIAAHSMCSLSFHKMQLTTWTCLISVLTLTPWTIPTSKRDVVLTATSFVLDMWTTRTPGYRK